MSTSSTKMIYSLFTSIVLLSTIAVNGDELHIDGTELSLFVHPENAISFSTNLLITDTTTWCLFYNFDDISNHLYCQSSSSQTQCHTPDDQHYTFSNISLCRTDLNNNDISSRMPIVGRFTDKYVCKIDYDLCCKLSTAECAINANNKNANINDIAPTLTLPVTDDGFLHFTDASIICEVANDAKCNLLPLILPTDDMILFESIFISQTSLLILFTDNACSTLLIQKCTIFTSNPICEILPQVTITNIVNSDSINAKNNIKINIIAYNECNLLISRFGAVNGDISSLNVYNYCNGMINEVNINNMNSNNVYNSVNNYITYYRNTYNNEITCFLYDHGNEFSLNCLSVSLQTVRVPTISPTNPPQVSINNISHSQNGLGPFSDASFITIVVVGGIVIVSCLVCGVVCFTKYQKEKLRQEWYKQRELKKNKRKKRQQKHIIPPNGSELSLCSNTMNTMNTNTFMTSRNINGNYTESEYEESTLKLSNFNAKLPHKKRHASQSNSTSWIRAKSYPRLPPKHKADRQASQVEVSCKYKERKTSISHRSLYPEEGGGIGIDETNTDVTHYNTTYSMGDITPLDLGKPIEIVIAEKDRKVRFSADAQYQHSKYQLVPIKKNDRKQLSADTTTTTSSLYLMPSSTDSSYDGETSPSSQTIEYHDGVHPSCLTRPSLHFSTPLKSSNSMGNLAANGMDDNIASELSVLSRCSFENDENEENEEQKLIETHVSEMPTPGGGDGGGSGSIYTYKELRIYPKITRRMSACGSVNYKKYQYQNVNVNGIDSEDDDGVNVDSLNENAFKRKKILLPKYEESSFQL